MAEMTPALKTSDLAPGECKAVEIAGKTVAVINVDGDFHALDNTCPHADGPLAEGPVDGKVIVCPWHMWRFDVTTGEACDIPGMKVAKYSVRVDGDDVLVEV